MRGQVQQHLATSDSDEKRDTAKRITACRALTADVLCLATVQAECDRAGVSTLWLEGPGTAPIGPTPTAASE